MYQDVAKLKEWEKKSNDCEKKSITKHNRALETVQVKKLIKHQFKVAILDNHPIRLGPGDSSELYAEVKLASGLSYWRATADTVTKYVHNLKMYDYSIERSGWGALGADWIRTLVNGDNGGKQFTILPEIAQEYDLLLITEEEAARMPYTSPRTNNIVVYVGEPTDTGVGIPISLARARNAHICDKCVWSHFFTPDDSLTVNKYFPPIYDASVFDSFLRSVNCDGEDEKTYFVQKRTVFQEEIQTAMSDLGYKKLDGEKWGGRSYYDFYKIMKCSRWIIAYDHSLSAGQVIAEGALLGTPSLSFDHKANAVLVSPGPLKIKATNNREAILDHLTKTITKYDAEEDSYRGLSNYLTYVSRLKTTVSDLSKLGSLMLGCCDDSNNDKETGQGNIAFSQIQ
tara:strand:+ start:158 stop:1351 length:1194 start_codon:yes stop_codon:yes gene_type:complete